MFFSLTGMTCNHKNNDRLAIQPNQLINAKMQHKTIECAKQKSIALVAHDNMKKRLIDWCIKHKQGLAIHHLFATGTTGLHIENKTGLTIEKLISGPLGGDQQIGALITEQKLDMMIFLWDPLQAQPHDPDVKALLRLAAVWNIPVACNIASADFMIHSELFDKPYHREVPDYQAYLEARKPER